MDILRQEIPELPHDIREKLQKDHGMDLTSAAILSVRFEINIQRFVTCTTFFSHDLLIDILMLQLRKIDFSFLLQNENDLYEAFQLLLEGREENLNLVVLFVARLLRRALKDHKTRVTYQVHYHSPLMSFFLA